VRLDPHYVEGRRGTLSEIAVPIIRGDRTIGALNLESNQLSTYGRVDLEVLHFFADAAAISIEKAMLHRQILENERIEEQMRVAQVVQSRLLPDESPDAQGYEVTGTCISTYAIGGDYFDYIRLKDDRLGIVVADVSGKGIPAALIMAAFRALLRAQARSELRPAHIAQALNQLLPDFTGQVDFVTAVYGILQPEQGRFTYANCGHNPPLLFRANGHVERLECTGPGLSVLEDVSYDACDVALAPGDLLLLYTDGVVEIATENDEEYGVERLEGVVRRSQSLPASAMIDQIVRDTQRFSGRESFEDDFTLVIIRRAQDIPGYASDS
jgi:serine phosphatase RsbU (regulator of sigma subunit)